MPDRLIGRTTGFGPVNPGSSPGPAAADAIYMEHTHTFCLGLIVDGNRRWAKGRGVSLQEGYAEGLAKLFDVVSWARKHRITDVAVYAFSTENWNRGSDDINAVFKLLSEDLRVGEDVRVLPIGDIERCPAHARKTLERIREKTSRNRGLRLWILFSYGARWDIVRAANILIAAGKPADEDMFRDVLSTKGMPYPHLIIRTGNARRLSNFLLWEAAYAELYFTKTLWPDFSREEFDWIMEDFGGVSVNLGK